MISVLVLGWGCTEHDIPIISILCCLSTLPGGELSSRNFGDTRNMSDFSGDHHVMLRAR